MIDRRKPPGTWPYHAIDAALTTLKHGGQNADHGASSGQNLGLTKVEVLTWARRNGHVDRRLTESCPQVHDRFWHFSDLAIESSVGLLYGVKRTYPDSVFDF